VSGAVLFAALVGFGFLTGGAAGLLGVGGGVMMVPFLTLVAGLSQQTAEATSLLVVLPTAIVATAVLHRKGVGDPWLAFRFGALGAAGGVLGALFALSLPGHVLRLVFAFFLAAVAVRLVRDGLTSR
jgi:uncharacterized protein